VSLAGRIGLFAFVAFLGGVTGYLISAPDRSSAVADIDVSGILNATLPDLTGKPRTIGDWRGKVLVINFWATWCSPCLEEIPHFVRLQRRFGDRGLQFVGIAVEDRKKVHAFAREHEINYPVLIGQLSASKLSIAAGNRRGGLPHTLVLDRSGQVISQHFGGLSEKTLEPIIKKLL